MTRNTALKEGVSLPESLAGRCVVLVGLMGAGKTSIGRRLAARLGLPFRRRRRRDRVGRRLHRPGNSSRYGERAFRDGERRVIRRLLAGDQQVLAFGGGAFMDAETRAASRADAVSVWLRCPLHTLVRRVSGRDHRPLLADGDPSDILQRLTDQRDPIYAEADIIVECGDESPDTTTNRVLDALLAWQPPRRLSVVLSSTSYDVVIGDNLLSRAGAWLAPVLPQKRAVVVTDTTVAALHLAYPLQRGLAATGIGMQNARSSCRTAEGVEEPAILPVGDGPVAGGIGSSGAPQSLRWVAAWWETSPVLPPQRCCVASRSCKSPPRCCRRWIPRSVARRR